MAHLVTLSAAPHARAAHAPRPGWQPAIDPAKCTGCGWCVGACPPHVLSLSVAHWKKTSTLHAPQHCTGCSDCAVVCPFHAIRMHKPALAQG